MVGELINNLNPPNRLLANVYVASKFDKRQYRVTPVIIIKLFLIDSRYDAIIAFSANKLEWSVQLNAT